MFSKLSNKLQSVFRPKNTNQPLHFMEPKVNSYGRQLTASEIAAGKHRSFVGGLWEEIGQLQFDFIKAQGLMPEHKLVDIGCGAMRGGVYFVGYLRKGNYYGLDINASLIEAANLELKNLDLLRKSPNLLVNDKFELSMFETKFDYAIGVSVFTHLYLNNIMRCLVEVEKVLSPNGKFYASFFQSPGSAYLKPILHSPGEVTTYYDYDPFHYSFSEMQYLAEVANLKVELVDDWSHPRNQKMLCFSR
jgi:SAM-dependent methyltransferase